jgi:hypothetical protein
MLGRMRYVVGDMLNRPVGTICALVVGVAFSVVARCGGATSDDADAARDALADESQNNDQAVLDSSTDVGIQSDAGSDSLTDAWTPAQLPGLRLWLDDTRGIVIDDAGGVESWADQSGMGNNAIQPNAASRPTFVPNAINGLDVVHDQLGNLAVPDSASTHIGTSDFKIVVIASASVGTSTCQLWSKYELDAGLFWNMTFVSSQQEMYIQTAAGPSFQTGAVDDNYHIFMLDGPTLVATVDSTTTTGPDAGCDLSAAGVAITLSGGCGGTINYAEVLLIVGSVSPSEEQQLNSYLTAKFAL